MPAQKVVFAAIAETDGEDDDEQCVRQYQVACTQHESHMKTRDREILSLDRERRRGARLLGFTWRNRPARAELGRKS